MCGRYFLLPEEAALHRILQALPSDTGMALCTGELFPTNVVPVIAMNGRPQAMKWGFSRPDGGGVVINARSETVAQKPMFLRALREGRCLVPASCYFEWERKSVYKKKHRISNPDAALLYMAGLSRWEPNETLPRFVILTREATKDLKFLHDRMPVLLQADQQRRWLNGDIEVLSSHPGSLLCDAEPMPQEQCMLDLSALRPDVQRE